MCESEKASKRASEYVRPRYASPRAMNSDLASLELVHPETRHFRYRLLGKAVILPGLCGSKNKQATCLAETKTRSNVPCVPITGLATQKTLKKGGSQPHTSARRRRSYLFACLCNSARRLCAVGQAIAHALWGFIQGCEVQALAGAPGCRRRMGQKLCAGHLCAGHMHQPISTCAGAPSPVQSQGQSRGCIRGWQVVGFQSGSRGGRRRPTHPGCPPHQCPVGMRAPERSAHFVPLSAEHPRPMQPFCVHQSDHGEGAESAASVRAGASNRQRVCWHHARAR